MTSGTPLAPGFRALLHEPDAGDEPPPEPWDLPIAETRQLYRDMMLAGSPPEFWSPVARTTESTLPLPSGPRPARVHYPLRPLGRTVVYFHGGGWTLGDLDTHDGVARLICDELGATVVSVHLPLAPESPFPGPIISAVEAVLHVSRERAGLGGAGAPLIVAGDSSGANIAAAAVRRIANTRPGLVSAQFLLYPATDLSSGYPDTLPCASGYWFEAKHARWFVEQYLPDPALAQDPDASLVYAQDLSGMPPTALVTGSHDLLHDEGARYADLLQRAGVKATFTEALGMIHGFFGFASTIPEAGEAARLGCAALTALLPPG
ncbi:alpha/beta hydrolase [Streptomyces sp. NPDC051018]|uniref:alpha/beta hydrolase n=1 Tax=Streptomyces sp. NPDC051018 TaxID=3365639 RepID=UPI00379F6948